MTPPGRPAAPLFTPGAETGSRTPPTPVTRPSPDTTVPLPLTPRGRRSSLAARITAA